MRNTISDFAANMKSFARPNLFEVEISPRGAGTSKNNINQRLNISCHTCQVPGLEILTTEKDTTQAGYNSIAYQKTYADVTMQFYCNSDMKELEIFQNWMSLMVSPINNHVGYHKSYAAQISIKNIDRQQKKVLTTTLFDAYPKSVGAIDLSYGANDEVMSISVVFTYRYYEQVFGDKELTASGLLSGLLGDNTEASPESLVNSVLDKTSTLTQNAEGKLSTAFKSLRVSSAVNVGGVNVAGRLL